MEKQEESKNEDCCKAMCERPNARAAIDELVFKYNRKIQALKTLSNMCPRELTWEQDEALFSLVIEIGRS